MRTVLARIQLPMPVDQWVKEVEKVTKKHPNAMVTEADAEGIMEVYVESGDAKGASDG